MNQRVEQLLRASVPGRRCGVCDNAALSRAVSHFLALRAAGETMLALSWFYQHRLQQEFGGPSIGTVLRHVRCCLRLATTGGPLG